MTIFFQNVRSFKKSKSEVMETLERHKVDLAIMLETFNPVVLEPPDHFEFRKNLNLYTNPGAQGRNSSGMFIGSK